VGIAALARSQHQRGQPELRGLPPGRHRRRPHHRGRHRGWFTRDIDTAGVAIAYTGCTIFALYLLASLVVTIRRCK
jgi:hypothetical protein